MGKKFDMIAIGELLIDFSPYGFGRLDTPLFSMNPGGAPANVLAMASMLGAKTSFIGKVGQDNFGQFLFSYINKAGIDTTGLIRDPKYPTTLAFVTLDENGERSFSFYRDFGADLMFDSSELNIEIIQNCKLIHFGSVSMTGEPARTATIEAVKTAKREGSIVSFDPNYRELLWESPEEAKACILDVIPLCDFVKVSEEEMTLLTGRTNPEEGAQILFESGPSVVVVTMGQNGALLKTEDTVILSPAYDVKTVDTTGAGDSFWGAFLYSLQPFYANNSMTVDNLTYCMDFANAAGGLTTTAKGAIPAMPVINQIKDCMDNRKRVIN